MIHKSVVIVGGGPIGLASAQKLANQGCHNITILDAAPNNLSLAVDGVANAPKPHDGRVLALSYASCQFLADIGAWDDAYISQRVWSK
jgi:2-polyprenyl-6-methoxyphenol hydroxylase-like FAD-dependent oxidoreductase